MATNDVTIRVDGSWLGLQPHLEAFMFEVLQAIQARPFLADMSLVLGDMFLLEDSKCVTASDRPGMEAMPPPVDKPEPAPVSRVKPPVLGLDMLHSGDHRLGRFR